MQYFIFVFKKVSRLIRNNAGRSHVRRHGAAFVDGHMIIVGNGEFRTTEMKKSGAYC